MKTFSTLMLTAALAAGSAVAQAPAADSHGQHHGSEAPAVSVHGGSPS